MESININQSNIIPSIFFIFLCSTALIILLRGFTGWYLKQNEIISLLKKIEENTRRDHKKALEPKEGESPLMSPEADKIFDKVGL